MANLTLAMDDELLCDARSVAFERDVSLTEMIRDSLNDVVQRWRSGKSDTAKPLMDAIERNSRHFGKITWTREDLYERS